MSAPEQSIANSKTELLKSLSNDPYLEYIVTTKARSQARAYLATVGSVVVAILAYGGFQFKSVSEEIRNTRTQIESNISTTKAQVEAATKSVDVLNTLTVQARNQLEDAKSYRSEVDTRLNSLMQATLANINNSIASQRQFSELQTALLEQTRQQAA